MIVEPVDIERPGTEQMVGGIYTVISGRYRTGSIELPDNIGQSNRNQRLYTHRAVFQQSRVDLMAGIQYQVRLLQAQCIGIGMRPLFEYFITNTPHKDGSMVTVAFDLVRQVTFMPFVEILRIIVRRFTFSPHVERFILYQQPHLVAKFEQLRSRWVMACTDRIDTHLLHDL